MLKIWQLIAGLNGLVAMVMSGLSMHAFHMIELVQLVGTGAHYQLIHAVVLLWLSDKTGSMHRIARWLFFAGMMLFSGGLYFKAFFYQYSISTLTPIGGACYISGWVFVALGPRFGRYLCGKRATGDD